MIATLNPGEPDPVGTMTLPALSEGARRFTHAAKAYASLDDEKRTAAFAHAAVLQLLAGDYLHAAREIKADARARLNDNTTTTVDDISTPRDTALAVRAGWAEGFEAGVKVLAEAWVRIMTGDRCAASLGETTATIFKGLIADFVPKFRPAPRVVDDGAGSPYEMPEELLKDDEPFMRYARLRPEDDDQWRTR